ncbi:DNA polymerase/3'-5' exonuclease PolX [soil metagenome]
MAWTNEELLGRFREIAELLQLSGADRFRVRAYERAADAITAARVDLAAVPRGELAELSGIGTSTAKKIAEYLDDGEIAMLVELREKVPAGLRELTRVPGLGPKTALQIHTALGIDSVAALGEAVAERRIRELPGLGAKTEDNIRDGIRRIGAKDTDRRPAADAIAVAEELCALLRRLPEAHEVAYAGSLRRMRETVGDIDILVASTHPQPVAEAFRRSPLVREVLASGDTKTTVMTVRDLQADLRVVAPEAWGAALVYFTGSKAHNIRIRERAVRRALTLNEYGLFRRPDDEADDAVSERVASRTEADVYAALDLAEVPPPMREDTGEVEAAAARALPAVVTLEQLRGDLHGHSDWSGDGKATLDEMVEAAVARRYAYWAVTDHAEDLTMNGVTRAGMVKRRAVIARLQEETSLRILDGAELNIAIDGGLDYDRDFLLTFDWCVASVHTLMTRPEKEQTARIMAAMEHPAVHAIGHPTGRMIGKRPGYDLDFDAICEAARETGTALEVNASPRRLDLSGEMVRRAVEAGVSLTISCDAHTVGDLGSMRYGVATAQRGWARAEDVLNTRDLDGLLAFTAAKRERWS